MTLILSVNTGSSSLKISLYKSAPQISLLLSSSTSSISSPKTAFSLKSSSENIDTINLTDVQQINDHTSAFTYFLDSLKHQVGIDINHISHVCHRVVHGGDFSNPVVIGDQSYHHIEELSDLAPLHNGAALSVIKAAVSALPHAKSIAFFDSAFHVNLPAHVSTYAIDQAVATKRGLRKYGFHGLSYAFVLRSVANYLNKPPSQVNIITLHLGSGASACAIRDGCSVDTSMGLTPLSGLPGATRAGDIDPSLIFHYFSDPPHTAARMSHDPNLARDVHVTEAEDVLNTKAGWKALTGTADFGDVVEQIRRGDNDKCKLAFDLFVDRILHYVGAYFLTLRGNVDALVFTGGIGERCSELREAVACAIQCLGFVEIDKEKNANIDENQVVCDIGSCVIGSGPEKRLIVCHTDEQFEMARQCVVEKIL
ncbi:hypothetical protein SERLA73DRAFT_160675 [Serpula lacrymans var. lacrymans S7.3]|uniref:Probable acetate kinase n=2 Tax=Serpula lacrymans var. lacrymans TaxID=341189 RepID=F8PZ61_SERL3|nr:uncharacterized protein SERLADRAFT_468508 [Serpula lacrymans var. lacrymans S7.9]EGN99174.1 hypothetical protein SERLA73DRAFT_160675 [Serpula lacrymans var. lacrymans S7.3]EGO24742.1 hypothetical protein SERLADRAFT_468508 [Serpula lacrymans var. lacrymans S7.9]